MCNLGDKINGLACTDLPAPPEITNSENHDASFEIENSENDATTENCEELELNENPYKTK